MKLNIFIQTLLWALLIPSIAAAAPVVSAITAVYVAITATAVGAAIVNAVISTAISFAVGKIFGKNASSSSKLEDTGQLQTIIASEAWIPRVYGETRVATVVTDQFVVDGSFNVVEEGALAYAVYAISAGEINNIKQIYYYDMPLLVNENPSFNTIYSGSDINEKFSSQIRLELKSGAVGQTKSTLLDAITGREPNDTTNPRYGDDDVGSQIAYLVLEIKRDRENGTIGEATPTAITLDIQGRKVRDIRQEGSPYVYSKNPALIALEEMRDPIFGAGFPNENINFYSFATWADNNDVEGFEVNGRIPQGATLADVFAIMEIHSDANIFDSNGVITALPSLQVVGSTGITIDDDNVIGGLVRQEPVTSKIFTNARIRYKTTEGTDTLTIRQFDDTTINQYGFRPLDITYSMCTSKEMAEKLGARALVEQTLPTISGTLNKQGYELGVGDVCNSNFTFSDILPVGSKLVITAVDKKRVADKKPVKFVGRLYDDEVFTQQLNNIITPAAVTSTAKGINDVPTPAVTNTPSVSNDNKVIFDVSNSRADLQVEWQIFVDSAWTSYQGPISSASPLILNLPNQIFTGAIRFRFVNTQGVKGLWYETSALDNTNKIPTFSDGTNVYTVNSDGSVSTLTVEANITTHDILVSVPKVTFVNTADSTTINVQYLKDGGTQTFPTNATLLIQEDGVTKFSGSVAGQAGYSYLVSAAGFTTGEMKVYSITFAIGSVVYSQKVVNFYVLSDLEQSIQPGFYSVTLNSGDTDTNVTDTILTDRWRNEFGYAAAVVPPINTIVHYHNDNYSFYRKWNGTTWSTYAFNVNGDAVIDGTLDVLSAQVGDYIQSLNFAPDPTNPTGAAPVAGWKLTKDGNLYLAGGAFIGKISSLDIDYGFAEAIWTSTTTSGGGVTNTTTDFITSATQFTVGDLDIDTSATITIELTNLSAITKWSNNNTFLSNFWTTVGTNSDYTNYKQTAPIPALIPASGTLRVYHGDLIIPFHDTGDYAVGAFWLNIYNSTQDYIDITGTPNTPAFIRGNIGVWSADNPSGVNVNTTWLADYVSEDYVTKGVFNPRTFLFQPTNLLPSDFFLNTSLDLVRNGDNTLIYRTKGSSVLDDTLFQLFSNSAQTVNETITISTAFETGILSSGDQFGLRRTLAPNLSGYVLDGVSIAIEDRPNAGGSAGQVRIYPIVGAIDTNATFTYI